VRATGARDRGYWRALGTLDAYFDAHMDLCAVHLVFNLVQTVMTSADIARDGRREPDPFSSVAELRPAAAGRGAAAAKLRAGLEPLEGSTTTSLLPLWFPWAGRHPDATDR
jgi:hypothetical protein